MRAYELARKYGVNVQGAVTWAFEFEDQPAFLGFRELATNGIDKPVLNVFRLFGMLGGPNTEWVAAESSGGLPLDDVVEHSVVSSPDVNAVATRSGNTVDVLVWNYHDADVAAAPAAIHLSIDGLRGSAVTVSEFRVDETHSNAYRVWQQMGSPAHPTPEQTQRLEKAGSLAQSVADHEVVVRGGKADVDLSLPRQGVVVVRLVQR